MSFWSNFFGTSKVEQPHKDLYFSHLLPINNCKLDFKPMEWYKENPFVHSAIEERASIISKAKFKFQKNDGEIIENEYTNKLNKPNTYQSGEDFLKQFIVFMSIYGTGYFYQNKVTPNQPINRFDLFNVPANKLTFDIEKNYLLNAILKGESKDKVYYNEDANRYELNLENLLPIFDSTTFSNPYFSESKLRSIKDVVEITTAILESTNTFMSNPAGIGIITSAGSTSGMANIMTSQQKEEVERQIAQTYGSKKGQIPVQVLSNQVSYISTTPKINDLKLNETLIQQGLIIFGAFGLPKESFTALASGSTFENQREAYKNYIENKASVIVNNIASTLTTAWNIQGGKLIGTYDHLAIMQEDEKAKADVFSVKSNAVISLLDRQLITIEEAKKLLNI